MKNLKQYAAILMISAFCACGESNTEKESTKENETSKTEAAESAELKQNGDYTQLYALDGKCKLSKDEIASLYGVTAENVMDDYVKEPSSDGGSHCKYKIKLPDGSETMFAVIIAKKPKADVIKEITEVDDLVKKNLIVSNSGDQYLRKNEKNGTIMLQNTNYDNAILIHYKTVNDDSQKFTLDNTGMKAVDLLVEKFKK